MKLIVFGAHPDDPETGCGGLVGRWSRSGGETVFAYATIFREDKTFFDRPARDVRTEESLAACAVLGVRPVIWEYPHEKIDLTAKGIARATDFFLDERPDVVVTHWPVDTHPDHRAVASLGLSAFLDARSEFQLYYFEVMTGRQTMHFHPTNYVDISDSGILELKRRSVYCHRSQEPDALWKDHELMHSFRGRECGVERAEAYVRIDRARTAPKQLPVFDG